MPHYSNRTYLLSPPSEARLDTLALWHLTEEEDFFTRQMKLYAIEREELTYLKGHRRIEMLAARWLLHEVMGGGEERIPCLKDEHGKPFLKDFNGFISLSHSKDWIAVQVADKPVGVDIQHITPKIARIMTKFMRQDEIACLDKTHYLEHIHVFWGAKEALYKAYGKKELDFRGHIYMEPFDYDLGNGTCRGTVRKDDFQAAYSLKYEKMGEYMLVYGIEEA